MRLCRHYLLLHRRRRLHRRQRPVPARSGRATGQFAGSAPLDQSPHLPAARAGPRPGTTGEALRWLPPGAMDAARKALWSGRAALALLVLLVLGASPAGVAAQWGRPAAQWGRPAAPRGPARCSTPEGRAGVCVQVEQCPELYAQLQGPLNYDKIMLLDRLRCGFEGHLPLVCCAGGSSSPPPPSPPRPPPTPAPSRPGGGGGGGGNGWGNGGGGAGGGDGSAAPRPQDVSRHPNLRLLPQTFCGPTSADRIVGGSFADLYAYPWIARLGYRRNNARSGDKLSYGCGGTLVAERYVLTAAHCVVRRNTNLVSVRLGEYNTLTPIDCREPVSNHNQHMSCLPPPIDVDVQQVVPHPEYNMQTRTNHHDIALVRLARPVDFQRAEFVRPVCLPVGAELQNKALDGSKLVTAGWGTMELETRQGSTVLLDVVVPAVPLRECQEVYKKLKTNRVLIPQQLCAGGEKGRDSCNGDSGGPLMREALLHGEAKTVQFGVVSFGPQQCGTQGVPGVYTRVGHYMQWILDTMRP